jgi:hypothetical protein
LAKVEDIEDSFRASHDTQKDNYYYKNSADECWNVTMYFANYDGNEHEQEDSYGKNLA